MLLIPNPGLTPNPAQKILLHPNPFYDLLMGVFYYSLFVITWYLILRKIGFSQSAVFIVSGLFGILTEQCGAIARGMWAQPIFGSLMAFMIMNVYGIFPMLAYMLTKDRFHERPRPKIWQYPLALFFLFVFWAVYGNLFHNVVIGLLPKQHSSLGAEPLPIYRVANDQAEANAKQSGVTTTLFGFTPFPYDSTPEALAKTHEIIVAHSTRGLPLAHSSYSIRSTSRDHVPPCLPNSSLRR
jgi:hypothetical protein